MKYMHYYFIHFKILIGIFFQAKKFVESLPQTVQSDITKEESEKLKAAMEAAGAMVEID